MLQLSVSDNHMPCDFKTSGLGSDNLSEALTNSANQPGDVEKWPPAPVAGAQSWRPKPSVETNGETETARNVGQLGTCGNGYAVNKLRGKHWRERKWLPKSNKG